MMVDWTKPIELMDGTPVVLDPDGWVGGNPDRDGDYWIKRPDGERIASSRGGRGYASMCCKPDGSEEGGAIQIVRNRAEPANDELAELRAFKEAAIARFPELGVVIDHDFAEAKQLMQQSDWGSGTECSSPNDPDFEGSVCDVVLKGIKRGRELERYAQGLTTPKD